MTSLVFDDLVSRTHFSAIQLIEVAVVAGVFFLVYRHTLQTDIPKIKNLPELPSVPIFGSLFLLGKHHARNCAQLVSRYGAVFPIRLGNRVCN